MVAFCIPGQVSVCLLHNFNTFSPNYVVWNICGINRVVWYPDSSMTCLWKKSHQWALPSIGARGACDPKAFYKLLFSIHTSMNFWTFHSRFDAKICEVVSCYMKSATKKKQNKTFFLQWGLWCNNMNWFCTGKAWNVTLRCSCRQNDADDTKVECDSAHEILKHDRNGTKMRQISQFFTPTVPRI